MCSVDPTNSAEDSTTETEKSTVLSLQALFGLPEGTKRRRRRKLPRTTSLRLNLAHLMRTHTLEEDAGGQIAARALSTEELAAGVPGLVDADVAALTGISEEGVRKMRHNRTWGVKFVTLAVLRSCFGVPLEQLFRDETPPEEDSPCAT